METNLIDAVNGERRFYRLDRVGSITEGLIAFYPLNGNATDAVGSNNGSIQNASPATNRLGTQASALSFNGTNSLVDFTTVPVTNLDAFTIAAWILPSTLPQQSYAVLLGYAVEDPDPSNGVGLGISNDLGLIGNGLTGTISGIKHIPSGYQFTSTNEWQYVAMTRIGGVTRFNVNGVQTSNISNLEPKVPTAFRIGASQNPGVSVFNGSIDDLRIYNRALNEGELQALMALP